MSQSLSKGASGSLWTIPVIAHRAVDFANLRNAARIARADYHAACAKFRERQCGQYIQTDDPKFRRATRKTYLALHASLRAERNALRRLETAVRNCADVPKEF